VAVNLDRLLTRGHHFNLVAGLVEGDFGKEVLLLLKRVSDEGGNLWALIGHRKSPFAVVRQPCRTAHGIGDERVPRVKDEAVGRLALIVRGADTPRRDLTPESRGLEAIAEGFKRLSAAQGYDDHETLRRERHLYDALYLYCGGDPSKLRRD